MTARELIEKLGLERHPEGGWYIESWRHAAAPGERPAGTAIYYLLEAGDFSHWHRVDATEIWHYYAGDPLELSIANEGEGRAIVAGNHEVCPAIFVEIHWSEACRVARYKETALV